MTDRDHSDFNGQHAKIAGLQSIGLGVMQTCPCPNMHPKASWQEHYATAMGYSSMGVVGWGHSNNKEPADGHLRYQRHLLLLRSKAL